MLPPELEESFPTITNRVKEPLLSPKKCPACNADMLRQVLLAHDFRLILQPNDPWVCPVDECENNPCG